MEKKEERDATKPVEKEYEKKLAAFDKSEKKRERTMYCTSVLLPISLIVIQLLITPEKKSNRHDLAQYKDAYFIPSITNVAAFIVLVISVHKIRIFLNEKEGWGWACKNKCTILHMIIFLLFTAVLVILFLAYLRVDDSAEPYSSSLAVDYFFMLY